MTILNEWANVQLPHFGSTGMRQLAALRVPPSPTFIDLRTLFRGSKGGSGLPYFITVKADMAPQPTGYSGGGKFYFAFAANGASGISHGLGGSLPGTCYPLSDGQEIRGRLMSHREIYLGGSAMAPTGGHATMVGYPFFHYVAGAGGGSSGMAPSGFFRLYGSSIPEGQSANNFPAP